MELTLLLAVLVLSIGATQIILVLVCGAIGIGKTDSFRSISGSLFMGSALSMVISAVANGLLATLPEARGSPVWDVAIVLVKTLLAAFAQPTVTSVVLVALLCYLCMAAAHLGAMVEDLNVLLESHKVFIDETPQHSSSGTTGKKKQ